MARLAVPLPPLGFGAFKIGRNVGTKYGHAYELPDSATVEELLNGLLDAGIGYIDTAPAYGTSEERIGRAISHRRGEFVLSTKVGEFFNDGASRHDFSADAVRKSVENSSRRLRTDLLDYVFIHSTPDDLRVLEQTDVVPTLLSLRDTGLVRGIGLSGYTAEGFRAAFPWADAVMVEYHSDNETLAPIIDEAQRQGIAVIVKKGLASGRLPAAEALSFVLGNPAVRSVVVGSLSLDHLRENMSLAQTVRTSTARWCDPNRDRSEPRPLGSGNEPCSARDVDPLPHGRGSDRMNQDEANRHIPRP